MVPWIARASAVAAPASWHGPVSVSFRGWSSRLSIRDAPRVHRRSWTPGPAYHPFSARRPSSSRPTLRPTSTSKPVTPRSPSSSVSSFHRSVNYPLWRVAAATVGLGYPSCSRSRAVGCCWTRGGRDPTALIAAAAPGPRLRLDHGGRASVVDNRGESRYPRSRRRRPDARCRWRPLQKQERGSELPTLISQSCCILESALQLYI